MSAVDRIQRRVKYKYGNGAGIYAREFDGKVMVVATCGFGGATCDFDGSDTRPGARPPVLPGPETCPSPPLDPVFPWLPLDIRGP